MSLLREIVRYSVQPFFTEHREKFSPKFLFKLIFGTLALAYLSILFLNVIFWLFDIEIPAQSESLQDSFSQRNRLLYLILLGPLIEELLFRSWLGSKTGIQIGLPLAIIAIAQIIILINWPSFSFPFAVAACSVFTIYFMWLSKKIRPDFHVKNFKNIYWATTIIFATAHINKYQLEALSPFLFLLVLPQAIAGFMLGYTRMRFGLIPATITHGIYNGTIFVIIQVLG